MTQRRRSAPPTDFLETPLADLLRPPQELSTDRIGPFRILGHLGAGGMGSVYLAERSDGAYRQKVAVKVLSWACVNHDGHRRFMLERQILVDLRHPGIARCLGGGSLEDGRPYLLMEYVDGVDILQYCDRARLGVRARVELLLEVCDAAQAAHDQGVIHRDIKPSNLLVSREGRPYLLDFGIAKSLAASHRASAVETVHRHLTPAYASPEHLLGRPATARSDVYSLAAILYELISGRRPRSVPCLADSRHLEEIGTHEPPALRLAAAPAGRNLFRDRRLLVDLDRILRQALCWEPEGRYASVRELADDLQRALGGEPLRAGRTPAWRRLRSWTRRHRVAAAVAWTCAICAVTYLAASELRNLRVEREMAAASVLVQRAGEIETLGRMRSFLPDPGGGRGRLLERQVSELRTELEASKGLARPAAHYALGVSLLAAGDPEAATRHLTAAWDRGLETPKVALELGRALGKLYVLRRSEIERFPTPAERAHRLSRAGEELRDPALRFVGIGRQAKPALSDLVEAEIALIEGRTVEAAALSRKAFERRPWLFEAKVLEGDVELHTGWSAARAHRRSEAAAAFARARRLFEQVRRLAPGAPGARRGECASWIGEFELLRETAPIPAVDAAIAEGACDPGSGGTSDRGNPLARLAWLLHLVAENRRSFVPSDHAPAEERAVAAAEAALSHRPADPGTLNLALRSLATRARNALRSGREPTPHLERAGKLLRRALEIAPRNGGFRMSAGNLAMLRAEHHRLRGLDWSDAIEEAGMQFRKALEVAPSSRNLRINLAVVSLERAHLEYLGGRAPDRNLAAAIEVLDAARERSPNDPVVLFQLGRAHRLAAEIAADRGQPAAARTGSSRSSTRRFAAIPFRPRRRR